MNKTIDWKLYSLLEETPSSLELYLGKPDHTSGFDASTGAMHYYTTEYFYYDKGIWIEFVAQFGTTFRPSPSRTKPRLTKIILFSKLYEKPNAMPYKKEILDGVYLGKKYTKSEIDFFCSEFEARGIKAYFQTNENLEVERVTLEPFMGKAELLSQLKIEQKIRIIPKYKLETEWQSQAHNWEVKGLYYLKEKELFVSVSGDSNCKFWSLDSSNCLNTFQENTEWKPGFSTLEKTNSENQILVGNKAAEVILWDLETQKLQKITLSKKQEAVSKIVWVADNLFLASVLHDCLYAYSILDAKIIYQIKGELAFDFFPFAVHKEKNELVNGNDQSIYNLQTGEKIDSLSTKIGYVYRIVEMEFSQNGKYLCIVSNEKFILFDYESKTILFQEKIDLGIGSNNPAIVKFILEDKYLLIAGMGFLKLFDLDSKKFIYHITDFEFGARSIEFVESRNLILLGSWEGRVLGFDVHSGEKRKIWGGHSGLIYSVAVNNDKSLFLSGDSEGYVYFWDRESKNLVNFYRIHTSTITTMEVLPNGNLLTGSWDKTIKLSDTAGKILWTANQKDWVYNAFWIESEQGVLVSNKEGNICLLDLNKKSIYKIKLEFQQNYHFDFDLLCYSDTSGEFAYFHNHRILIHDIHTGEKISEFQIAMEVARMSFSPNGSSLFFSDYSGNIHCMDRNTGEILTVLRGHTDRVSHFSFYEDWMTTTGREEKIFLWNWKTLELLAMHEHSAGGVSPVVILDKTQILCSSTKANLMVKKIRLNN